jgi:hypothetical protein
LYRENSDALFILNTRNIEAQVRSMHKFGSAKNILTHCQNYLKDEQTQRKIGLEDWIKQHNARMRSFFESKPEAKFVEMALESFNSTAFEKYFDSKNIPFPHCNKTPK